MNKVKSEKLNVAVRGFSQAARQAELCLRLTVYTVRGRGEIEMSKRPLVSVVMPAYNTEKYIGEAIQSVIHQTMENWDMFIIDDGSTDATASIADGFAQKDPRIHVFRNDTNIGAAATRNRGLEMCTGKYVALLDSDDIWLPQKLETQLALAEKTGAELIYCSYSLLKPEKEKDFLVPACADFELTLYKSVVSCSTALLSSDLAQKYRFDGSVHHEDLAFWLRVMQDGYKAYGCPEVLAKYRVTSHSRSSQKLKSARNRWKIYRQYLYLPLLKSCKVFAQYVVSAVTKYV